MSLKKSSVVMFPPHSGIGDWPAFWQWNWQTRCCRLALRRLAATTGPRLPHWPTQRNRERRRVAPG